MQSDIWTLYNEFWTHSDMDRVRKIIQRYELFRMTKDVPGSILECGIMKGVGLCQWLKFRDTFALTEKKVYGFDIDGFFGEHLLEHEENSAADYISECDIGSEFSFNKLENSLRAKGFRNFEFIIGDIVETASQAAGSKIKAISLLHIDVDGFHPSKAILDAFWPYVSTGGIVIFDEYFSEEWGEKQAADEWAAITGAKIQCLEVGDGPVAYAVKN